MTVSVLVVDDDAAFRALTARVLGALGLAVVGAAATVAEALVEAERLRPQACLVDVGLPDGDGVALAGHLAKLDWHPRVVLVSSDPEAASAEVAASVGAVGFIPKDQLVDGPLQRLLVG